MQKFKSVEQIINQLKPEKPIYCIRKNSIRSAVKYFNKNFPGKILYAEKTNPHPSVIQTIINSGVEQFDVASIEEIKSIRNFNFFYRSNIKLLNTTIYNRLDYCRVWICLHSI